MLAAPVEPRIANRLLRRVRDFAQVKSDGRIDGPIAARAMDMLDVDNEGFDFMDRKLLLAVIDKFMGDPWASTTWPPPSVRRRTP